MKVHEDFNKGITKTALNKANIELRKLKKGEVVTFRINNIKPDPTHPTGKRMPACKIIPSRDIIYLNEEPVEIAAIKTIGSDKRVIFYDIKFTRESEGTINCIGGTAHAQNLYEYLMLSNFREGNPIRDPGAEKVYYLVDPVGKAKEKRASRSQMLKAVDIAENMTDDDVLTFIAAQGWKKQDMELLRDKIEEIAMKDPVNFMRMASDRNNEMKATIKRAIDEGVLVWDKSKYEFRWSSNDELITRVPRSEQGSHLDGLLNFILNAEHGPAVYKELTSKLKGGNPGKAGAKNPPPVKG